MKKFILLFMLFFTIGVTYAQDSTQYVTNSNAEKLIDKYSAKVENAIIALAEKLQQPVEHVYRVLIKQQIVNSIVYLVVFVIAIIFVIVGIKFCASEKAEWEYGNFHSTFGIISIITGLLISLGFWFSMSECITGFINPEYGALKDIIEMIK